MSSPNASPPPESTAEMAARLSTDLFNPIPSTYPQSSSQMAPPYYQQNPQQEPLPYFQQYPQQEPLPYFQQYPQYPHIPHQTYGGTSSGIGSSSQFTTPIASPSPNVHEIQAEEEVAAQSPQQVAPIAAPAAKKKRLPGYGAEWLPYYEVTYHADGTMNTLHCKVKGCPKGQFTYKIANGMSSFKRHADSHKAKNERPQENANPRLIQTLMNSDGTRTHQKYDEKVMLSELARYITHKEQPISMGNCISFARLVIRGCGQPMYKRFHHRKMVNEIKNQFTDRKNELRAIFAIATNKVSITSDIWTAGKHGLGYSCITGHWIDANWVLQKRIISFRVLDSPHTAIIIYRSIMEVLEEYNLKRDLQNKIFSISFDNASNNIASIDHFKRSLNPIMDGAMFHQKCACHIINLVVKAGLKTTAVKELIVKFKGGLAHIFSNMERKQRFAALCNRMHLSRLRVPWDVDTRWNSTYRMLNRCLPYRAAIGEFLRNSNAEGSALEPSIAEWGQLARITNFLETFFQATVKLSCSYSPTAFELLKHLYQISKVYAELDAAETADSTLAPIVDAMK